jgi:lantibiotic modifying enzyme
MNDPQIEAALAAGLEWANWLAKGAIWHGAICAFEGAQAAPSLGLPARWRVFGADYYDGSAGIARSLAWAAQMDAGDDVRRAAQGALLHSLQRVEGWGLHSGGMGVALVAIEIAPMLDRPEIAEQGYQLAQQCLTDALAAAENSTAPTDLLIGLAGVVHAAARLSHQGRLELRHLANAVGHRLVACSVKTDEGLCWPMFPGESTALCGLAHGAAGIALALDDLASVDPDRERWLDVAEEARSFERAHFDPGESSWADLRPDSLGEGGLPNHPHMWCQGSVGIAHDRLTAHRRRPNCPLMSAECSAALYGARREAGRVLAGPAGPGAGYGANASQCHGISGLIDLLVATGTEHDRKLAHKLAAFVRDDAKGSIGPRSGLASGEPTPGMMLGLAGAAWGQFRAALPDTIPCAWTPAPSPI